MCQLALFIIFAPMNRKYTNSVLALAVAALMVASCKKDYNCHCDMNVYNPLINTTTSEHIVTKYYGTERGVKAKCQDRQTELDSSSYIYANCAIY